MSSLVDPDDLQSRNEKKKSDQTSNFSEMYEKFEITIFYFIRNKVKDDKIAEDLTQITFFKAWRSQSTLLKPNAPLAWLKRIAQNTVTDYYRSNRNAVLIPLDLITHEDEQFVNMGRWIVDPEEQVERNEKRLLVNRALNQITPIYRDCLLLKIKYKKKDKEIAKIVGISPNSVAQYVKRGRIEFLKCYSQLLCEGEILDCGGLENE